MTENKNFKMEQEAFHVRRTYEKELHSNKNVLSTLGFMAILGLVALASQGNQYQPALNEGHTAQKTPVPVCSQKVDALCLKNNEELVHSR